MSTIDISENRPHGNGWGRFMKAAGIRAARTMAQAAVVLIPTGAMVQDVNWAAIAGVVVLEGIVSVLTSIYTGLPEVPEGE